MSDLLPMSDGKRRISVKPRWKQMRNKLDGSLTIAEFHDKRRPNKAAKQECHMKGRRRRCALEPPSVLDGASVAHQGVEREDEGFATVRWKWCPLQRISKTCTKVFPHGWGALHWR